MFTLLKQIIKLQNLLKMKKILLSAMVLIATNSLTAQIQNPLLIPVTLTGPTYNLTIDYDSVQFFPGIYTQTAGVNGAILGPTLIINKGDNVNISLQNNLTDTTTMHWHGVHLPSVMDGGPHTVIPPSTTWNPTWIGMDYASTMWYHPHLHHKTYKHLMLGLAGVIINKDNDETVLALPRTYGVDDIPLILQTKVMTANYQLNLDMNERNMDTMFIVNATRNAYVDVPAQMVRLRILNGALMRTFNVGLSNGADFWVIASDGGLLSAPVQMNQLLISNGERYEILVDLSAMQGSSVDLMNFGSGIPSGVYGTATIGSMAGYNTNPLNGADFVMLTLNIGATTANAITNVPSSLVSVNAWSQADVDVNRQFSFTSTLMMDVSGPFLINNSPFDMGVINEVIVLNNTEIWTLNNQTMISHPFHIHDIQFNILEINGAPPPLHMQGWKDVVLVPAQMGSAKFITKFEDFADPVIPFMYHCHIIGHEDEGMMGQFTVVDNSSTSVEILENNIFLVYPNPAKGLLNLTLVGNLKITNIVLYDISGKLVKTYTATERELNIKGLSSGQYLLKLNTEKGIITKKVQIE